MDSSRSDPWGARSSCVSLRLQSLTGPHRGVSGGWGTGMALELNVSCCDSFYQPLSKRSCFSLAGPLLSGERRNRGFCLEVLLSGVGV